MPAQGNWPQSCGSAYRPDVQVEAKQQTKDKPERSQATAGRPDAARGRPGGPVLVGALFALVASVLTLVGLWREDNLSLRNVLLGLLLGAGTWGLVSWAIATAVLHVEQEVATRSDDDS